MAAKIIGQKGGKLTLQVEIDLDASSMLNSEERIQSALNELGSLATAKALGQFDTTGAPIEINGEKLTSKGQEKKIPSALRINRSESSCISK